MNEIKLDYLKDTEGNYIIKQTGDNSFYENKYFVTTGEYSENLIISTKYFEKKLKHKLEDIINSIEETTMLKYKILKNDFLSEKFTLDIKSEEDFNPIFKTMSKKEITEYTKNSKKVRININFEITFKVKPHLWFKAFIESLKKIRK